MTEEHGTRSAGRNMTSWRADGHGVTGHVRKVGLRAGCCRRDRSPGRSGQESEMSIVRYDASGAEGGLARGGDV